MLICLEIIFFFKDEKISGVIDFYFACYYFYIYDLAIVINDWCFSENGQYFNKDNCLIILGEYQKLRELSDIEKKSLNILLRAAAAVSYTHLTLPTNREV